MAVTTFMAFREARCGYRCRSMVLALLKAGLLRHLAKIAGIPEEELR